MWWILLDEHKINQDCGSIPAVYIYGRRSKVEVTWWAQHNTAVYDAIDLGGDLKSVEDAKELASHLCWL